MNQITMRTPSFLLTAALFSSSGCATDYQPGQTTMPVTAKAERNEHELQGNRGKISEPSVEKVDPCAALIQDPYLKDFYDQWRAHFDALMKQAEPAPQELHDPNAQMCEMVAPNMDFIIARDGQFAGHEIKPNKPDRSHRVALEVGNESLDKNTNPNPGHDYFNPVPFCQGLVLNTWKEWDLMMPDPSTTPQFSEQSLSIMCDPTATAYLSSGGCWHEEPSPENGDQVIDGCGGGAMEIDRKEALALIECVRKAVQDKGTEMCLQMTIVQRVEFDFVQNSDVFRNFHVEIFSFKNADFWEIIYVYNDIL